MKLNKYLKIIIGIIIGWGIGSLFIKYYDFLKYIIINAIRNN
jgi:hypothetical protein